MANIKAVKSELDSINSEVKVLSERRKTIVSELSSVLKEATEAKNARDKFNSVAGKLRTKRNALSSQVRSLHSRFEKFRSSLEGLTVPAAKANLKELERKFQSGKLSTSSEEDLVVEIDFLESVLKEASEVSESRESLSSLRDNSSETHKDFVMAAREGESNHKRMRFLYKRARSLKKSLSKVKRDFVDKKQAADVKYQEYKALRGKKRAHVKRTVQAPKAIKSEVKVDPKVLEVHAKDVLERFKRGEAIDSSDMSLLQNFDKF